MITVRLHLVCLKMTGLPPPTHGVSTRMCCGRQATRASPDRRHGVRSGSIDQWRRELRATSSAAPQRGWQRHLRQRLAVISHVTVYKQHGAVYGMHADHAHRADRRTASHNLRHALTPAQPAAGVWPGATHAARAAARRHRDAAQRRPCRRVWSPCSSWLRRAASRQIHLSPAFKTRRSATTPSAWARTRRWGAPAIPGPASRRATRGRRPTSTASATRLTRSSAAGGLRAPRCGACR